jgi:hypothetical protein
MKKITISCMYLLVLFFMSSTAFAGPPLPLHSVEGSGGILLTNSAYLVNPSEDDKAFGLPSVGATYVNLGNGRHLEAYTMTETLWGRLELGYSLERFDLGDLPWDLETATGIDIHEDSVDLHNLNARVLLLKEGDFGQSWLPALTLGVHYKQNSNIEDIDRRLLGTLESAGIKDEDGVDVTLYATRLITSLARPLLINVGLRSTEAAHTGLLGFTDDRKTVFEANFGVLVLDNLVIGGEYRQKPDEYTRIPGLIEDEDDWWDVFVTYVVNDHMTVSAAYAHLGDVLNHEANSTYGFKFKLEL